MVRNFLLLLFFPSAITALCLTEAQYSATQDCKHVREGITVPGRAIGGVRLLQMSS